MKAHIAKLRMGKVQANKSKNRPAKIYGKKYIYWQILSSQSVQEIVERQDKAYRRFFDKKAKRPPKFKKVKKFTSFVLKQKGWERLDDTKVRVTGGVNGGKQHRKATGNIVIQGTKYKFVMHRPLEGTIKTVTIKRDSCNRLWICFSVVCEAEQPKRVMTGQTAGLDFGLKTFLTDDIGKAYKSPEFLKQELDRIRQLSKNLSRKQNGSKARKRAKYFLSRAYIRVSDKRTDSHYKLAHELCRQFDTLYIEDLNIAGMKRLWGRKVSDLAFSEFVEILEWIAKKYGVEVVKVGRFEPTSKMCSHCGKMTNMPLHQRVYECQHCGLVRDRDHNAAKNIKLIGASIPLPEACKTGICSCVVEDGRSSRF